MTVKRGSAVAVVGAGAAGSAAAHTLRNLGYPVAVFERGEEIGGRASTFRDSGFTLDTGASVLLSNYQRTLSLVGKLAGPGEIVRYQGRSGFYDGQRTHALRPESRRSYLRLDLLPARAKLRFAGHGLLLALKGGPGMFDLSDLAQADDGMTIATWARRTFGDAGYEYVVRPSIEGMTGFSCEDASAATGKALLNAGGWRGLRFCAIRSGTGALCEWLLEGSDCRLACPVESVAPARAGVVVHSAGGSDTFAGAVVATDAHAAAKVAQPGALKDAVSHVRYAASVHVALAYAEDPWPSAPVDAVFPVGPGRHAEGTLALLSRKSPGLVPEGAQVASVYFGDEMARHLGSDVDAVERARGTIERFLGPPPRALFEHVFRRARGVPIPEPGGFSRLMTAIEQAPPRLRFAGDYLCHQGLEAAIRSGERAASELDLEIR